QLPYAPLPNSCRRCLYWSAMTDRLSSGFDGAGTRKRRSGLPAYPPWVAGLFSATGGARIAAPCRPVERYGKAMTGILATLEIGHTAALRPMAELVPPVPVLESDEQCLERSHQRKAAHERQRQPDQHMEPERPAI